MKRKFSFNINHAIGLLLMACIVLTLMGCGEEAKEITNLTTDATVTTGQRETTATTEETEPSVEKEDASVADMEREVSVWELHDFLESWSVLYREEPTSPTCKVTVTGLYTPVVLELEAVEVKRVLVWDRTLEVDGGLDDGTISFSIGGFGEKALYINGRNNSWLLTEAETFHYPCEEGIYTRFSVSEDGLPEYHRIATATNFMEQWETAPLDSATDRGNLYDETGTVEMVGGKPEFCMQERTLMGEVYDFDALFEKAIADGLEGYEGCENADDVLARNKEKGTLWLTYPWEG